jgi:predicted outer membrane protein
MRRLPAILLLLAALFLIAAAGCGGGSDSTPDNKQEAIQRCKDEAAKISDSNARDAAEKACAGDKQGAQDAVKRQCLDQANSLPAGSARDQAVAACNKIGG